MTPIQTIARFVQERRRRASPVVMNGEVIEAIGADGLQSALEHRWLVPDPESGFLQVTAESTRVAEIEEVAATPAVEESTTASSDALATLVMEHAGRSYGNLSEVGAPGTGKPGPGYTPTAPAASAPVVPPAAPTPTTAPRTSAGIGDDVTVAEEGRSYTGKVSSRDPATGQMRISFGPDQRPTVDRAYRDDEVQRTGA